MLTILFAKLNFFISVACPLPKKTFFFLPPWWEYLQGKQDALGNCIPDVGFVAHPNNLWLVGLALLDMLLRVAGFVAVISIIIAGVELIRSEGSTEKATNARQRIVNSLLGLAIAAGATALVVFVGNTVGGEGNGSGLPHTNPSQKNLDNILNASFVILGALAVLFIVLAGLRMITSGDNPTKVAESRRQILFASLGLVVIAAAGTIVHYVLGRL
jgi:cytochrome bd-type quinol oxidase subunit 2